jgi:6-phosphogluconate dehydrogenase
MVELKIWVQYSLFKFVIDIVFFFFFLVKTVGTDGTFFIMVKAGTPTQAVIDSLKPHLTKGALVVDLANSHYEETKRRVKDFEGTGIHFFGVGVSGGEEGARHGPSIMPGGSSKEVYDARLKEILEAVSAKAPQDGQPCVTFIGKGAAGHYVKMVHNGIEYADMQVIAEAYDLLRRAFGMGAKEIADVFAKWKNGVLDSFLVDITIQVLRQADPSGKGQLVDYIVDVAQMKGTGTWTVASSLELKSGVMPIPGIYCAVESRAISAKKDLRLKVSQSIQLAKSNRTLNKEEVIAHLEKALYVSKIASYAQGLQLIEEAAKEYDFGKIDLARVAEIWRDGCIIRARFLGDITNAYRSSKDPEHLLLAFSKTVVDYFPSLKYICNVANDFNVPTVAFDMARNYIIQYSTPQLPLNLTQIQRDFFGAHTYQRTDKQGSYHTNWSGDRKEVESTDTH